MRRVCSILLPLLITWSASAVTMAWTPIGNPGNACDPNPSYGGCYGGVGYSYSIGTYDVTTAQYVEFLNAKAKSDPLHLYSTNINNPLEFGNIMRSGSAGSYTYSPIAGRENMPVNWVSFYDALRFANWMSNGQGNGDTETGSYTLLGGTPTPSNGATVTRNAQATIVLTSEDEWYKAAYYDPRTASYFAYPYDSNTQTVCSTPTAAANHANCSNFVGDLTPVGSYSGSRGPYGTFDQGGDVYQWNEAIVFSGDSRRGARGGDFGEDVSTLAASSLDHRDPTDEFYFLGFRLAMVPEPSSGALVIAGLLGLAGWRRGRA